MKQRVKIVSLNIANYDDHPYWCERKELITKEIVRTKPDVMCFQEVRYNAQHPSTVHSHLNSAEQVLANLQQHGLYAVASLQTSVGMQYRLLTDYPFWEGLSLISTHPVSEVGLRKFSWKHNSIDLNHRILQMAIITVGDSELCLFHTHFTYDMMGLRDTILETIDSYMRIQHRPVLLIGDMNATPDTQEFALLQDAGFIDLWKEFQPSAFGFTYPAINPIQRIDYIWANEQAASMVENVEQWAEKPDENGLHCSDHLGVMVTLRI